MNLKVAETIASSFIADDMADVEWEKFESSMLIEVKRGEEVFTSSAVAIQRNILLTCAHSVENFEAGRVFWNPRYNPESKNYLSFKKVVIHPDYCQSKSNYANDLAIIVLNGNLPSKARPAKIHANPFSVKKGMQAHRIGFGAREGGNIRTWTNPEILDYDSGSKSFILKDEFGKVGDSGGPVYLKINGKYKLFALHSTKEGADKSYTVSVSDHMHWIEKHLPLKQIDA
ncbi:MAG: trypsin-like serine protease [Bacteriovoracaceae bacterium]